MHTTNELLIKMIKEDKSVKEMSAALNISDKQLFQRLNFLRNVGINLRRYYYDNGMITYSIANPLIKSENVNRIITDSQNDTLRFIAVSDEHIGHNLTKTEYMNYIYDFAIKEGIHIIFNTGDLFENNKDIIGNIEPIRLVSEGLRNYPYDRSIINAIALGNHDAKFVNDYNIDISSLITDRRHDIICLGYSAGEIMVGKRNIILHHDAPIKSNKVNDIPIKGIMLSGHKHMFKLSNKDNYVLIKVPTIGGISINDNLPYSFLDITIKQVQPSKEILQVKQYSIIDGKTFKTADVTTEINVEYNELAKQKSKSKQYRTDSLEKSFDLDDLEDADEVDELENEEPQMTLQFSSQIEKFNKKYKL